MKRWLLAMLVAAASVCRAAGSLEVGLFADSNLYDDASVLPDAGWSAAAEWTAGGDGGGRWRLGGSWRKHLREVSEDALGLEAGGSWSWRWAEGWVAGLRLEGAAVFQYATVPASLYDRQEARVVPSLRWASPGGLAGFSVRAGAGYENHVGLPYSGPVWEAEASGILRPWALTELEAWARWDRKDFVERAVAVSSNLFSAEPRLDETVSWGGAFRQDVSVFLGFEVSAEHRRVRSNGTLWVERVGNLSVRSVLTNAFGGERWTVSMGWRWVPVLSVSLEGRVSWVSEVWNRKSLSFVGEVPVWSPGPVRAEGWEGEVVCEGRLAEGWTGFLRLKAGGTVSADMLARYPEGFEVDSGLRWSFNG